MKKHKLLILATMVASIVIPKPYAYAENTPKDIVVSLQINNPIMEVNGKNAEIDEGRDTKPIIYGGRTLVPIRAIIESFGGKVDWDASTRAVLLNLESDNIKLTIDSTTAYLNGKKEALDVAPTVINGRTLLPIRFIAEGFNLGVGWDGSTSTVYIIKNGLDDSEYKYLEANVPEYSGNAYVQINSNKPLFKDYEIIPASFEYYSNLDSLGRCDVCFSSVATDLMPTQKRESISSVTPTGWVNASYDCVDGKYLYNRCHLIGFQLTGENANKRNLITGTRYLNVDGMLPFENLVADYVKNTGNHVAYRSSPIFEDNNLVADGVLLEGYSVEDKGYGLSFCVYCYNVQPNITIDYLTGASFFDNTLTQATANKSVYRTPSGKKYHMDSSCGGSNSYKVTLTEAISAGLTPCSKCVK